MTSHVDDSHGWCCDGRTYQEHASTDGQCCQSHGTKIEDLPEEGRKKAQERLDQSA